ncbi:MAG TPA: amidase [Thermomicrobiales bacterium]|nr:amidase [Thermomicrobiales bacterium]
MSASDLAYLSIARALALLDAGEVSSEELTSSQLDRIATLDERLNAYITVLDDRALADARLSDQRRRDGDRSPLLGIPIALKDLFATQGIRTTAGSAILADHVPDHDATVTRRLSDAGAVLLGKTNMMEFAYGYPHENYGETRNPWELSRTAGGSSGGSAAAVAAGMAYGALGSDTGGSIRSPAAYCGIVGLKPTYGRVSRHGVVPLAWSLDHVGPLARTARDAALLFDAIAGHDPLDPASSPRAGTPSASGLDRPVDGLRIGLVEFLFERHVQPSVRVAALDGVALLERLGAVVEPVTLEHAGLVSATIMPIVQAEATSYHRQSLREHPELFSAATRENLRLGAAVLAIDYLAAQRLRRRMTDEVNAALTRFDALVFPTQPIVAPVLDAYQIAESADEDILDIEIGHTGYANLTGHPALSMRCGFTEDGLPVGLQLTGRILDEGTLLRIAHQFGQASEAPSRRPDL